MAINAFDIDIVKAIVEKKGFDIQNLLIGADELSPLYHAAQRVKFVSDLISKGRVDTDNNNINWAKLNVPGMFIEDKMAYLAAHEADPLYHEMKEISNYLFYGLPPTWERQLTELTGIVKYLAERTKDVDAFAKKLPNGWRTL